MHIDKGNGTLQNMIVTSWFESGGSAGIATQNKPPKPQCATGRHHGRTNSHKPTVERKGDGAPLKLKSVFAYPFKVAGAAARTGQMFHFPG